MIWIFFQKNNETKKTDPPTINYIENSQINKNNLKDEEDTVSIVNITPSLPNFKKIVEQTKTKEKNQTKNTQQQAYLKYRESQHKIQKQRIVEYKQKKQQYIKERGMKSRFMSEEKKRLIKQREKAILFSKRRVMESKREKKRRDIEQRREQMKFMRDRQRLQHKFKGE